MMKTTKLHRTNCSSEFRKVRKPEPMLQHVCERKVSVSHVMDCVPVATTWLTRILQSDGEPSIAALEDSDFCWQPHLSNWFLRESPVGEACHQWC